MVATGYCGVPGETGGKVHAFDGGTALCGWKPRREMEFQWCSWGITFHYLECAHCRKIVAKMEKK